MTNFLSALSLGFLGGSQNQTNVSSNFFNPSESIYTGFLNFSNSSSVASNLVGYDLDESWSNGGTSLGDLLNNPPEAVSDSLKPGQHPLDLLNNQPEIVSDALNYYDNNSFFY